MIKHNYVGMINFSGANRVYISDKDVSKMTGVKGVDYLVLDNVKGLQGTLDLRGVKAVEFINVKCSHGIIQIICKTDCKIKGLKFNNKMSCLIIYEPVKPVDAKTKLIKDYMFTKNQIK